MLLNWFILSLIIVRSFCQNNDFQKTPADQNVFCYVVSIRRTYLEFENHPSLHVCTGVIIDERSVLTAATCFYDMIGNILTKPRSFEIVAGTATLSNDTTIGQWIYMKSVVIHPKFKMESIGNNIAVILLATPFIFDSRNVCLAKLQGNQLKDNKFQQGPICTVVGWGSTAMNPFPVIQNTILMRNEIQLHSTNNCKFSYSRFPLVFPDDMICARTVVNYVKSYCFQDTGSPLVCDEKVTGFATLFNDCNYFRPMDTGYINVSTHKEFILRSMTADSNELVSKASGNIFINFGFISQLFVIFFNHSFH